MNAPVLVDAHHHLWDLAHRPQLWLDDPGVASIRRTFTPDDLHSTATHPVAGRLLHGTVVTGWSESDVHALLAGTASAFYRLPTPEEGDVAADGATHTI